jgi:hypothetical protein
MSDGVVRGATIQSGAETSYFESHQLFIGHFDKILESSNKPEAAILN